MEDEIGAGDGLPGQGFDRQLPAAELDRLARRAARGEDADLAPAQRVPAEDREQLPADQTGGADDRDTGVLASFGRGHGNECTIVTPAGRG